MAIHPHKTGHLAPTEGKQPAPIVEKQGRILRPDRPDKPDTPDRPDMPDRPRRKR